MMSQSASETPSDTLLGGVVEWRQTAGACGQPHLHYSMNTAEKDKNDQYHEMFHDPDGDVILRSSDGVLFRTHSFTLRRSSSFFGAMFSLPQPSSLPQSSQTITLDEDSSVITPVLLMVYNLAFPSSTVCTIVAAANSTRIVIICPFSLTTYIPSRPFFNFVKSMACRALRPLSALPSCDPPYWAPIHSKSTLFRVDMSGMT